MPSMTVTVVVAVAVICVVVGFATGFWLLFRLAYVVAVAVPLLLTVLRPGRWRRPTTTPASTATRRPAPDEVPDTTGTPASAPPDRQPVLDN